MTEPLDEPLEEPLTPAERDMIQRLPREADPPRLLEERIVATLRHEGILRHPRRHRPSVPGSWIAAGLAASLLLFVSGMATGQWLGARTATRAFLAVRAQDAAQAAVRVQEAGSAYVNALVGLGAFATGEGRGDGNVDQGREAAFAALYAAAAELARLSPDDATVARVLRVLEDAREPPSRSGSAGAVRQVIWF